MDAERKRAVIAKYAERAATKWARYKEEYARDLTKYNGRQAANLAKEISFKKLVARQLVIEAVEFWKFMRVRVSHFSFHDRRCLSVV